MVVEITISGETKAPKPDIRILSVQVDTKLKWGSHVKKVQEKMVTQTQALTKISASTWEASFTRARQVYSAVIRPAIIYGSTVWHTFTGIKEAKRNTTEKMAIIQNRCLQVVAGVYKTAPIEVLHAKTMMLPIQKHLELLQARAQSCFKTEGQTAFVRKQCRQIVAKLRKQKVNTLPDTSERKKDL